MIDFRIAGQTKDEFLSLFQQIKFDEVTQVNSFLCFVLPLGNAFLKDILLETIDIWKTMQGFVLFRTLKIFFWFPEMNV